MSETSYYRLLAKRLDHIEEHLARIGAAVGYRYTPTNLDSNLPPEVVELVNAGKKIAAIKLYQEMTGAGLNEAKNVIDGLSP